MIISFLTNILVDGLGENCTDGDIQQLLSDILGGEGGIFEFCSSFPNVRMFMALPNVRLRPSWFGRQRSGILRSIHQFMESSPLNLQMLEDYSGDLDKDQVHFTVWSGVNYIKHLVDRSVELLLQPAPVKNQRLILVLPIVILKLLLSDDLVS